MASGHKAPLHKRITGQATRNFSSFLVFLLFLYKDNEIIIKKYVHLQPDYLLIAKNNSS